MPDEPVPPQPPSPDEVTQMMTPPIGGCSILPSSNVFPSSNVPLSEVIGDFEVQSKLGAGGMGAVYAARQISLGRTVALKILPARFMEDALSISRFQREARVAASLSHANIVRVFAAGKTDTVHYIAMELIEGEDLGRRIKRDGRLAPSEALRICAEVARGLDHAWRTARLIHRDIKPANIFLAQDGVVKVGDLGLAKSILGQTSGLTHTGTMMGTPHYISPEQARGDKELDFRSDIYSLGCTLYRVLTGEVPYGGTDAISIIRQHLDSPLPAILKVWPQCPIPLARLVGKMLKKTPRERHADYAELIAHIESVRAQIEPESLPILTAAKDAAPETGESIGGGPLPAPGTTPPGEGGPAEPAPPPAPPPKSRLPLFASLSVAVVVLVIIVFAVWPAPEKLTKAQLHAQQTTVAPQTPLPTPNVLRPGGGAIAALPDPKAEPRTGVPVFKGSTAEPWQDVLSDPAKLELAGPVERKLDGLRFFGSQSQVLLPSNAGPQRDGAVRMRAVFGSSLRPQLVARLNDGTGCYWLFVKGPDLVFLERLDKRFTRKVVVGNCPLRVPLQRGQEYELELRAVGSTLTARLDGELLGTFTDTIYAGGRFGVRVSDPKGTSAQVTALEVLNLDTPLETSPPPGARPTEATKDAPYINSLGMKFAPVPIVGGPTSGQRVLFSIWETRVQDYEAFLKESPREWPKAGFAQGPTHPAVNVEWAAARDFCAWLTARERKAGRLGPGEAYRLPTDHEWSCAVGLGPQENALQPAGEKNRKIPGLYPWGTDWPPPDNVVNLSGEEARGKQVEKAQMILAPYRDAHAATAPCGTFVPNIFGLCDLGGNVWEWCEDRWVPGGADRVLRGTSFADGNPKDNLLTSSRRHSKAPGDRSPTVGFRVVLAPAAGPP